MDRRDHRRVRVPLLFTVGEQLIARESRSRFSLWSGLDRWWSS
jgi:hypothetical protein